MEPTFLVLRVLLGSATLASVSQSCHHPAQTYVVSPCASAPVDWPERSEPPEKSHIPPEERLVVTVGVSATANNTTSHTISYTYLPPLRNEWSDQLIVHLQSRPSVEAVLTETTQEPKDRVDSDSKSHLASASVQRTERARMSRPRFGLQRG
jgi:hypothetical protein